MTNILPHIWIGCLPIGRDLDAFETHKLLTSLPKNHNYILDLSDIYSGGRAISIISEIYDSLPLNIFISLKLGLTSFFRNDYFSVEPRSWAADELYECFLSVADKMDISRFHSLQLHALPYDSSSICNCMASLGLIKSNFSIELGISNIDPNQYTKTINQFPYFDFVQLHANVIEQRLVHEFLSTDFKLMPKYFILNRVFCRGLLNDLSYVFNNPTSRFNVSNRIKSSLTKERLLILQDVHQLCQDFSLSIQELALGFCFITNVSLRPILGGKNLEQILHSIAILDNLDDSRIDLVSNICDTIFSRYSDSILAYPQAAFEK